MGQLRFLYVVGLLGVGMPPRMPHQEPSSWVDSFLVLGTIILAFWWSVRFLAWIDAKIETKELLHEIYREFRKQRSRRRESRDPEHGD